MKIVSLTSSFGEESRGFFHQGLASLASLLAKIVLAAVISCAAPAYANTEIVYVNGAKLENGDGLSWATAYNNIQSAFTKAVYRSLYVPDAATQLWVAEGVYPVPNNYYYLPTKVDIYGGFRGDENAITDREFFNNLPVRETTIRDNLAFYSQYVNNAHVFYFKNTTNRLDGLRFQGAGGILQEGGTLTVISSTFTRVWPLTTAYRGNGIFSYNNATLTVENSHFLNGRALVGGGAIAANNAASVTINNSRFDGNQSVLGGAISIDGNTPADTYQYGTVAFNYGPARPTSVKITNSVSDSNSASSLDGGAIAIEDVGPVEISNSVFNNNSSAVNAGAIDIENAGKVDITNGTFTKNSTVKSGGALSLKNTSEASIVGSTFGAPGTNGIPVDGNSAATQPGTGGGGAIVATQTAKLTILRNKFYGNSGDAGGAIFSIAQKPAAIISITESTFIGNKARAGGAIIDGNEISGGYKTVPLTISGNTFSANTATWNGPAIFYDGTESSVNGRDLTKKAFDKVDAQVISNFLTRDNPTLLSTDIYAPIPQ
jgi:hypothetical protein